MKPFLRALILSVAVHGFLAVALSFYFGRLPAVELPMLDLSAIEISFSDFEREAPPVQALSPEPAPPPPAPSEPGTIPDPVQPRDDFIARKPSPQPLPEPVIHPKPILPDETTEKRTYLTPIAPASPAPRQARVDAPPRPLKNIRPDYPRSARQHGDEGDVTLELSITERGTVSSVNVVSSSGHPELDAAAVRAVETARFSPAKSGPIAIPSTARITISFRLSQQ